jgi:hypothetical protein
MFPCQRDPDPHEETDHQTDDETKPGCVTNRTFAEIENARRFIFVHRHKSAPVIVVRKTGETLALSDFIRSSCFPEDRLARCHNDFFRIDDISKWGD